MHLELIHMVGVRKSELFSNTPQASHVTEGMIKSMTLRFSSS